jgi:hypothetical protein
MKKTIAIFINTFLRDAMMYRCIESIEKYMPEARIYLTDNGNESSDKYIFYLKMRERGHFTEHKTFNYPFRKAFLEKLPKLQDEEFIMKMDDDMVLQAHPTRWLEFLQADPKIGLIAGSVWHTQKNEASRFIYNIWQRPDGIYRWTYPAGFDDKFGYIYADIVPEFWIARREIFDEITMDGNRHIGQGGQENFYTEIWKKRMAGEIDWRCAYTNEVEVIHDKVSIKNPPEYKKYRNANREEYLKEWGPDRVIRP